jgi:protein-S-isoprenylcysteine O-methyltransferase Ste14
MTSSQLPEIQLATKALVRLLAGFIILLAVLLLPAGTVAYWEAWAYMAILLVPMTLILVYLLVNDPKLLERRMRMVEQGQRVVTTGPYAIVRHPMYLGTLVMFLSSPVALGDWWAVIPALPLVAVLVARIRNEEQLLAKELEGYQDYAQTTRYRLIPGVW